MNPPKCDDTDYIHFLIASQRVFACTEATRCQPDTQGTATHDAFTRLLARQSSDPEGDTRFGLAFSDEAQKQPSGKPHGKGNVPFSTVEIGAQGRIVHLKAFGFVKVFRTVSSNGDAEYWTTSDLKMTEPKRKALEKAEFVHHAILRLAFAISEEHRVLHFH